MKHFLPVAEPANFDSEVRTPGNEWLLNNPAPTNKKLPGYWRVFSDELRNGFNALCGYSCMHVFSDGEVDHYISVKNNRNLAFEWSNYRYSYGWANNFKKNFDNKILDPFEVGDGWFEVQIPSLQLIMTDKIPIEHRARAEFTIEKLQLRHGKVAIRMRRELYDSYKNGSLALSQLEQWAPLLADAVKKHGIKPF